MRRYIPTDKPDYTFIALLTAIVLFGLAMLSSASTVVGFKDFGDNYYYLKHQALYGLLPGIFLFFLAFKINYRNLRRFAFIILIFGVLLLVAVFIPGVGTAYGTRARSWINVFGFSIQSSEIAKLVFLIYLSAWLEGRGQEIKTWYYGFLPFLFTLAIIAGLVIFQPDVGTVATIIIMSLAVFFVAGGRLYHFFFLGGLGLGGLALLMKLAPYSAKRLEIFLHPELDPQGIGYHINQALLAIGSGGLLGLGLGQSRQKFQYLPEVAGDSIFAVIAEELGFIFTIGFIILFVWLIYRGLKIAKNAPDDFAKYLVCGIIAWWFFQAIINIGGMLGILPMTGVPLPFVSYGGTALAISLAAAGIVANISREARR
ncbi:putative lipid II flippase FtsW [Patescibacteria group bacterium]|nr:putative lipid II flippase FtsW [Patescibacteria group bacterium]MCG2693254.1 putative lipid II flippase FtsW [Candidatus Parcubacteria bacterium]